MPIDDPIDQFDKHHMQDNRTLPEKLANFAGEIGMKLVMPKDGLAVEILPKVIDVLFNKISTEERVDALWELIKQEFRHVETTKASHDNVQIAIQMAFVYDRQQRDDKKRERYVQIIGNALRSEQTVNDVLAFIQTIERLTERDIVVLKVINKVMNKPGDWKVQPNPGGELLKVHPNTFTQRSQELTVQIAIGLGQATEKNTYSRETGHGICNRLQGFGLAHEIQQTRELPLTNYCFRPSLFGMELLKLLGEDVPNIQYYKGN